MIRFIVIITSIVGTAGLLHAFAPSTATIITTLGGFGITWCMLISSGMGYTTYKITK